MQKVGQDDIESASNVLKGEVRDLFEHDFGNRRGRLKTLICLHAKRYAATLLHMPKKNANAVALGRRGGKARLKTMTPEQRSAIAKAAANARWSKKGNA